MIDKNDARSFLSDYSRTLKSAVAFLAARLRQNLLPLILITGLATAGGAALWYSRTPYFESDLVLSYTNERFSRKTFGEMIQKLNILAGSHSARGLARTLQLSPEITAKFLAVEGRNRWGSLLHEDITGDHQALYITLKATDKTVFAPVQDALVRYLSSTPYQRQIGELQVAKINRQLALLEPELRKVDSAIDAYTVAIRAGLVFRDTVPKSSDLTDILDYKRKLGEDISSLEWRRTMESGNSVLIMHGFTPPDRPGRGSRKIIAGAAILGLLTALGWALIRGSNHKVHA